MHRSLKGSRVERTRHFSSYLSKKQSGELPNVPNRSIQISKTMTRADITDRHKEQPYMDILRKYEKQAKFFEAAHYDAMEEEDIKRQYKHLRRTLQSINAQLAVMLEGIQAKPLPSPERKITVQQQLQQKQKQIENNRKLLHFLSIEYALVLRRLKLITACPRELTEQQINRTQREIEQIRVEMRDLKKDYHVISGSLLDEESLIREMKDLQRDRYMVRNKIDKQKVELQKCQDSLKDLEHKSEEVSAQFSELESKAKQIDQVEQQRFNEQKRGSTMIMKRMHLDGLKKKSQSNKLAFEQLYLQKLKDLESCIGNIRKHSHCTNEVLTGLGETKGVIGMLTRKIKELSKQEPVRRRPDSNQHFTDKNFTQSSIPVVHNEGNPEAQVFNTIDIAQLDIEEEQDEAPQEAFLGKGGSDCQHNFQQVSEQPIELKQPVRRIHGTAVDLMPQEQDLLLPYHPNLTNKIQLKRFNRSISTNEQEAVALEPL